MSDLIFSSKGSFVKLGDDALVDISKVTHIVDSGDMVCHVFFDGDFHNGLRVNENFEAVANIISSKSEQLESQKKCG